MRPTFPARAAASNGRSLARLAGLGCLAALLVTSPGTPGLGRAEAAPAQAEGMSRQQLLVLHRGHSRLRLDDADRRFWILACRLFSGWRKSLLVVKPETVLGWHRKAWRATWYSRCIRIPSGWRSRS